MWQYIFTNKQTVLLQCLGKLCFIWNVYCQCFIVEKMTTLCFVLSLYSKNRFYFHNLFLYYLSRFVFLEPVFFAIVEKKIFLNSWSNNQLSCGILRKIFMMQSDDFEQIINYDWRLKYKFLTITTEGWYWLVSLFKDQMFL